MGEDVTEISMPNPNCCSTNSSCRFPIFAHHSFNHQSPGPDHSLLFICIKDDYCACPVRQQASPGQSLCPGDAMQCDACCWLSWASGIARRLHHFLLYVHCCSAINWVPFTRKGRVSNGCTYTGISALMQEHCSCMMPCVCWTGSPTLCTCQSCMTPNVVKARALKA